MADANFVFDPSSVESARDTVRSQKESIVEMINESATSINNALSVWEGDARETYRNTAVELNNELRAVVDVIEEYISFMTNAVTAWEQTQGTINTDVDSFDN